MIYLIENISMKKTVWIILAIVFLLGLGRYNTMVGLDESVDAAWAQVENQYQRRADLVPNLVATVQGIADQEQSVFTQVTQARAQATQVQVNIDDPVSVEQFAAVQGDLTSALSRLLAVVENYPELRSSQNFLELQAQLEGTENRIATERMRYNDTVRTYNVYIRRFPSNIFAGLYGFDQAELFEADEGAENAPVVDFAIE